MTAPFTGRMSLGRRSYRAEENEVPMSTKMLLGCAVICWSCFTACAGSATGSGLPVNENDSSAGLLQDADATSTADIVGDPGLETDSGGTDGGTSGFQCNPAQSGDWIKWLYKQYPAAAADQSYGPPPYDAQCKAKFDRSCGSVCDCKFISVQCTIMAASVSTPWTRWPIVGPPNSMGVCSNRTCAGSPYPSSCQADLACVNGQCLATGSCATAQQADWP